MESAHTDVTFNILADLPEIIEYVLKKLPVIHLNTCARVCRSWHEQVSRIKKNRQQPTWFMSTVPCVDDYGTHLHDQFSRFVQNVSSEPCTVLFFCSSSVLESPVAVPSNVVSLYKSTTTMTRSNKRCKLNIMDYVKMMLPSYCTLVGVATDGIVGTPTDNSISVEMENAAESGTMFFFPQMDGIEVVPFHLHQYKTKIKTREDVESYLGIPKEKDVKSVLIFYLMDGALGPTEDKVVVSLMNLYDDIVVSGGYVDNIILQNEPVYELLHGLSWAGMEEDYAVGIAFCGESIHVSSCVIPDKVKTQTEAEICIKRLYDSHTLCANNLGFMFACIGRGWHHYKSQNIEANLFKKYFPRVPLHGFFGNGEIGHDKLVGSTQAMEKVREKLWSSRNLIHSFTTIITVISWGEPLS